MAPRINVSQVATELNRVGRKLRAPKHPFRVDHRPWEIQPFMLAPVVPGETLKSALIQARVVSDPIANPLIGWWLEHHVYFVRLTDLEDSGIEDEGFFRNFLINPSADLTAGNYYDIGNASYYSAGGHYDFVQACTACVVKNFFHDEEEPLNGAPLTMGNYWMARLQAPGRESWMQSLMKDDSEVNPDVLTGAAPDDPNVASGYQEFYDRMVEMGATDLTYEDWCRSFGIKGATVKRPGRPELVRYIRSWQYPSSHVDAATGAVNSVVSWAIDEHVNKERFFKEPGFLLGVTLARPKVYVSHQTITAASMLDHPFSWLPATLRDKPELGLRKFAAAAGPIRSSTAGYWIDIRDLFVYGDQFVNVALDSTGNNLVGGPALDMTTERMRNYPSVAEIEGMFASAAATGTRAGRLIKQDGAVDLHILSSTRDET